MRWLFRLTEALFPTDIYCLCCGSVIDGSRAYALCDHCIGKVTWARGKTCAKCGKILAEDSPRTICHDCASRTHAFRKGYTCAQYNLYERAMMMDLKYRDRSYIGGKLGQAMADRMDYEAQRTGKALVYDLVIPVPLHRQRMAQRGYNQAELLAAPVARRLGSQLAADILVRSGKTQAMKELGAVERIENMRHAFAVAEGKKSALAGRTVLLVDDIYTTGATADACARVLLAAGACAVDVYTFAAGGDRRPSDDEETR